MSTWSVINRVAGDGEPYREAEGLVGCLATDPPGTCGDQGPAVPYTQSEWFAHVGASLFLAVVVVRNRITSLSA
jgi:hypothetical protein